MTVSSYLFQSPYASPVQVGRPDPSVSQKEQPQSTPEIVQQSPDKKQLPAESMINPTLGGGVSLNLTALQGSAQSSASDFKALNNANQAQKAYTSVTAS